MYAVVRCATGIDSCLEKSINQHNTSIGVTVVRIRDNGVDRCMKQVELLSGFANIGFCHFGFAMDMHCWCFSAPTVLLCKPRNVSHSRS
jgi:hypothetical protein